MKLKVKNKQNKNDLQLSCTKTGGFSSSLHNG
jgi:hypothetical protein